MSEEDDHLLLMYVAGCCDEEDVERVEALLCAGCPSTAAMYAEACAIFHALPMGLTPVDPPEHCRHSLLGRITADGSAGPARPRGFADRSYWPLYVASGMAACLLVALIVSVANGQRMATRVAELSSSIEQMSTRDRRMTNTLDTARVVMSSPRIQLASLSTKDDNPATDPAPNSKPFGRVLFCPITRRYQFAFYHLPPLPAGRTYELWLITPR